MDDEGIFFVNTSTKCVGYGIPKEKSGQERFERIATLYITESEMKGATNICYEIVNPLVTDSEKGSCTITRTHSTTEWS